MLSRIIHGARISLTVGLIGIAVSFVLALIFGGLSGYYGGTIDILIQRFIEVIRAFPELPLWMALSAALPPRWDPILVYVGITVILGLLEWTGLARSVRGKLLSVREEDFATAAVLMGGSPPYVIRRHLLPAFTSHLIVSATLSIPNMILGETALSFLGLGLRPPITSWGVLLSEAQNMNAVALYPWLLTRWSWSCSRSWPSTSWATGSGTPRTRTPSASPARGSEPSPLHHPPEPPAPAGC